MSTMKLYLISQDVNRDFDTYDSAVVCAGSEAEARRINPDQYRYYEKYDCWTTPDNVTVQMIGEASENIERGVVLASFNAG